MPLPEKSIDATPEGQDERLQKLMARAGIASRRAAEKLIREGKVTVNGHVVTELGVKADPQIDRIVVEGKPLHISDKAPIVLLLHKPRGYVTTKSDPQGRATVLDLLPRKFHTLHPVGRLDFDTAGILLLTDDGDLTHLLTHPSNGVEKIYHARVRGEVPDEVIKKLQEGVVYFDGENKVRTAPCFVRVKAQGQSNSLLEVALREGRNRQVRHMMDSVGHPVSSLRRACFGGLDLEGVKVGTYRILLPGEVHALRKGAEEGTKRRRPSTPTQPRTDKARTTKRRETSPRPSPSRNRGPADARSASARPASARPAGARPAGARPTNSKRSSPAPMGERVRRAWHD